VKLKTIVWDGKPITKPGMYSQIPLALYHGQEICDGPSISSSGLRQLNPQRGSPAHFYARWSGNPDRVEPETEKKEFVLGRAVHHLLLGEPHFAKLFVQQPAEYPGQHGVLKPWSNNAHYCQRWNAEQAKLGRSILDPKQIGQIRAIAKSVGSHPFANDILHGLIERSLFWKDKETGVWLKIRPDAIPTDSADFADLKSTTSVVYSSLAKSINEFGYYQQAALVREGCKIVLGMDMQTFTFVFVEKAPPFAVRDIRLEAEDMDRGQRMNRACIRTFAKCLKDKRWPAPGYGNEGNERVGLSGAAREAIDNILRHEGLADGND